MKTPKDKLLELQTQFRIEREQTLDISEDHFLLVSLNKKVDLLGITVLGNGAVESSLIYQIIDIQKWRSSLTKVIWTVFVPLVLGFLFFFFSLLWLLITNRAEIIFK